MERVLVWLLLESRFLINMLQVKLLAELEQILVPDFEFLNVWSKLDYFVALTRILKFLVVNLVDHILSLIKQFEFLPSNVFNLCTISLYFSLIQS